MNIPFLVTLLGPALGVAGWFTGTPWLFWTGVAICIVNLMMNLTSGVMKLPILPALFMAIAAVLSSPWWHGLGTGIVVWTGLEAAGELYARVRHAGREGDA